MPPSPAFILILLLASTGMHAAEPIRSIADIRNSPINVDSFDQPLDMVVTVTLFDPDHGLFFVHDGENGIFVVLGRQRYPQDPFRPGDRVRIIGHSSKGDFLPLISVKSIQKIGSGPPLPAQRISASQLQEPSMDCQWVEFKAVIKGTLVDQEGGVYFDLESDGWRLNAFLSRIEKFTTPPWELLERTVLVRTVVGTRFNQQRQMCARDLFIPGLSFIVTTDSDPMLEDAPLRKSTQLLRVDSPLREQVLLRGAVTMVRPGEGFNLRDSHGSIFVRTAQPLHFELGDIVEARGFPEPAEFRPRLNAIRATKISGGPPPEPRPLDLKAQRHSSEQQELVSIDATVIDMFTIEPHSVLRCVAPNGTRFEAWLRGTIREEIAIGSTLRLTGICDFFGREQGSYYKWPTHFRLQMRSRDDITVVASPPWWTPRRLAWLASGIGGIAALAGLWAVMLQREVRAQAEFIRAHASRAAAVDERNRIARELHDTLEQDLMGVTLLLDDAAEHLNGTAAAAGQPLTIARRLLRRSREESRSTIRDLRSVALEQLGLTGAIKEMLEPIAAAGGIEFRLDVRGTPRALPAIWEITFLRVAQEAVANAVRHSGGRSVAVTLEFEQNRTRLEVSDDGRGFDPASVRLREGHFGLQGIRERANKLGGSVEIHTRHGSGTRLEIALPNPPSPK